MDYQAFLIVLAEAVERVDVKLYAYCLMPNHWHLVLSVGVDGALSRFMHWLTTTHARRWQLAKQVEGLGAVYQGRFKSIPIQTGTHFLWVCRYVERNALRATLVKRAEEWMWTSLAQRRTGSERPALADWPTAIPSDWSELVNTPQTAAELEEFRRASHNGAPYGRTEWVDAIQSTGGQTRHRSRGRPRTVLEK